MRNIHQRGAQSQHLQLASMQYQYSEPCLQDQSSHPKTPDSVMKWELMYPTNEKKTYCLHLIQKIHFQHKFTLCCVLSRGTTSNKSASFLAQSTLTLKMVFIGQRPGLLSGCFSSSFFHPVTKFFRRSDYRVRIISRSHIFFGPIIGFSFATLDAADVNFDVMSTNRKPMPRQRQLLALGLKLVSNVDQFFEIFGLRFVAFFRASSLRASFDDPQTGSPTFGGPQRLPTQMGPTQSSPSKLPGLLILILLFLKKKRQPGKT